MLFLLRPFIKITCIFLLLSSCGSDRAQTEDNFEELTESTSEFELELFDSNSEGTVAFDEGAEALDQTLAEALDQTLLENPKLALIDNNEINSYPSKKNDDQQISAPEIELLDEVIVPSSVAKKSYCLEHGNNDSDAVASACLAISNRLASISNEGCLEAKLQLSRCSSVEEFPILYSEFAPISGTPAQGRILIVGGTHGDELTSVSMVFRFIEKLNQYHTGLFHWHMVPMMNPDGVLKPGATRTNANGVDLNRNLPSADWREKALKDWQNKTGENERRYPGKYPASEPETQWLIDEINDFQPDAIISVHAPFGLVDFDAPVLSTAPKSLGRLFLNILGTYPGSLGNYAGINKNIPVITLELPHAWYMPSDDDTARMWEDIVSWLRKNVDNPVVLAESE